MKRQLLLLRHGKSDWPPEVDDFDRPLKKRGRRGARHIGRWLMQQRAVPDWVVSSPAERAVSTARLCCREIGLTDRDIHIDKGIYMANLPDLLRVLAMAPRTASRILLVGHNPGLETLLGYLAEEVDSLPEDDRRLPTATLVQLSMPNDWSSLSRGCASLIQVVRARSLEK